MKQGRVIKWVWFLIRLTFSRTMVEIQYSKERLEERSQFACKIIFLAFVLTGLLLVILLHVSFFVYV